MHADLWKELWTKPCSHAPHTPCGKEREKIPLKMTKMRITNISTPSTITIKYIL
jgi:hypothetical protein